MAWFRTRMRWTRTFNWPTPATVTDPRVPDNIPVHRSDVIGQLGAELQSPADAFRYRDNFARLLPGRIQDLTALIRSKDQAAAVAVLMTLRVGSCMVGAPRLEYVSSRCLADIRSGRKSFWLPALVREAERFLTHLAAEQRSSE